MTFRNFTEVVIACENTLGWTPKVSPSRPLWKVRSIEAHRLKQKMEESPAKFTFENLGLAMEYCRRKQLAIKNPAGLCQRIDAALKHSAPAEPQSGTSTAVQEALAIEYERDPDDGDGWIARLHRAQGRYREDTLREWRQHRGASSP